MFKERQQELLNTYSVFAHFYTLYGSDTKGARWENRCRSALEIMAKEKHSKNPGVGAVDAVFVMMNPGSSEPLEDPGEFSSISVDEVSRLKPDWVRTRPDTTQYQIMQVMHDQSWKHVLIINLSDIRNANSNGRGKKKSFVEEYRAIERHPKGCAHSIFCEDRREELERHLARAESGRIVVAWGVGSYLCKLTERARKSLQGKDITGWRKETRKNDVWKYYHPLPRSKSRQSDWLKKCLERSSEE